MGKDFCCGLFNKLVSFEWLMICTDNDGGDYNGGGDK